MTPKPLPALVAGGALVVASLVSTVALTHNESSSAPSAAPAPSASPKDPTLGGGAAASQGNGNGSGSNQGHPITLTGTVTGTVAPGSPATLTVTITNPNNQDVVVTSLTGTITSATSRGLAGLPACSPSWYSVGTFTGSKTIAKGKTGTVSVPLTLTDLPTTNQDNCKGSSVQFSFTAQAQQS